MELAETNGMVMGVGRMRRVVTERDVVRFFCAPTRELRVVVATLLDGASWSDWMRLNSFAFSALLHKGDRESAAAASRMAATLLPHGGLHSVSHARSHAAARLSLPPLVLPFRPKSLEPSPNGSSSSANGSSSRFGSNSLQGAANDFKTEARTLPVPTAVVQTGEMVRRRQAAEASKHGGDSCNAVYAWRRLRGPGISAGLKCGLLDDLYNANPVGFRACLRTPGRTLGQLPLVAALYDLLKLSEDISAELLLAMPPEFGLPIDGHAASVALDVSIRLDKQASIQGTEESRWRALYRTQLPVPDATAGPGDALLPLRKPTPRPARSSAATHTVDMSASAGPISDGARPEAAVVTAPTNAATGEDGAAEADDSGTDSDYYEADEEDDEEVVVGGENTDAGSKEMRNQAQEVAPRHGVPIHPIERVIARMSADDLNRPESATGEPLLFRACDTHNMLVVNAILARATEVNLMGVGVGGRNCWSQFPELLGTPLWRAAAYRTREYLHALDRAVRVTLLTMPSCGRNFAPALPLIISCIHDRDLPCPPCLRTDALAYEQLLSRATQAGLTRSIHKWQKALDRQPSSSHQKSVPTPLHAIAADASHLQSLLPSPGQGSPRDQVIGTGGIMTSENSIGETHKCVVVASSRDQVDGTGGVTSENSIGETQKCVVVAIGGNDAAASFGRTRCLGVETCRAVLLMPTVGLRNALSTALCNLPDPQWAELLGATYRELLHQCDTISLRHAMELAAYIDQSSGELVASSGIKPIVSVWASVVAAQDCEPSVLNLWANIPALVMPAGSATAAADRSGKQGGGGEEEDAADPEVRFKDDTDTAETPGELETHERGALDKAIERGALLKAILDTLMRAAPTSAARAALLNHLDSVLTRTTPLQTAVGVLSTITVHARLLLDLPPRYGLDVDVQCLADPVRHNVLATALERGHLLLFTRLLAQSARPDAVSTRVFACGESLLHQAIRLQDQRAIMSLLGRVPHGVDLDADLFTGLDFVVPISARHRLTLTILNLHAHAREHDVDINDGDNQDDDPARVRAQTALLPLLQKAYDAACSRQDEYNLVSVATLCTILMDHHLPPPLLTIVSTFITVRRLA